MILQYPDTPDKFQAAVEQVLSEYACRALTWQEASEDLDYLGYFEAEIFQMLTELRDEDGEEMKADDQNMSDFAKDWRRWSKAERVAFNLVIASMMAVTACLTL